MGDAQERLARLIKEVWGPSLRDEGFTGSGKIWTLPDKQDWVMLSFQASAYSTGDRAKFTINLLVVSKEHWNEARARSSFLSVKPSPSTLGPHRYTQRVGHLLTGRDDWWELQGDGSNENQITLEVLRALLETVVPVLRREGADKSPGPRGSFANARMT